MLQPLEKNLNCLSHEQLLECVNIGKDLTSELDPNRLLEQILKKISGLFPSEIWSLLLLDEETSDLKFELSVNLDLEKVQDVRIALGQGVAGHCALNQQLLVSQDVNKCEFFTGDVDRITGSMTKSLVCVPLIFGGSTLGVLEIVNPKTIDNAGIALLSLLSDYLAIAVENARRYKKIHEMSIKDGLTDLYNQRYLYDTLEQLANEGKTFSLIFMDIDNFKSVVDTVGHLNGSRVIEEFARKIASCLDQDSFAVAYGGDEFVVVLPGADKSYAAIVAENIRNTIRSSVFLTAWGHQVRITASFGISSFPDDADDYTELLAVADKAMFWVKNSGKDRVEGAQDCP